MKILQLLFISLFLYTGQLIAQCPSIASFTYSISGAEVTVKNTSHIDSPSVNQVQFYWEFPEGSSSNQQFTTDTSTIVKHTYSSTGYHWISMLLQDSLNSWCMDTASVQIYISCNADFDYTVNDDTVFVSSTSIFGSSTTLQWSFGDGTAQSNTTQTSHVYTNEGTYNVCLTIRDTTNLSAYCLDTICKLVTIGDTCEAGFDYQVNGLTVYLTDQSNTPYQHFYTGPFAGDSINNVHTFDSAGTYIICQLASDHNGCYDTYCDTIVVPNNSCNASFTQIADSTQLFTIQILNNSSNASTHNYLWDFGDDSTSTDRNPTHEYQAFGSYVVCLTITDSALNCISTFCDTLGMDSNGVLFKGSFTLEVMDPLIVGIKDKAESTTFNIFPNPAIDQLSISSSEMNPGMSEIKILNIQGKEVLHKEVSFNDGHCIIDLDQLPSGVYFLKMQGAEKEIVKKFIKQ